jgi:tetratricopeptide (TPR) repeat protein
VKRLIAALVVGALALVLGYAGYSEFERRGRVRVHSVKTLTAGPGVATSWLTLPPGFTFEQSRDVDELTAAIAREPGDARFYVWRSMLYDHAGNHDAALQDIDIALGLQPSERAHLLYLRHRHLDKLGRSSDALADVLEAIELAGSRAGYYSAAAELYSRRGDVEAGVAVFDDGLRQRPRDFSIVERKAEFLSDIGRHDLAISEMARSIDGETNEFFRWLRSAGRLQMFIDAKRFKDGLAAADRHIGEYPDDDMGYRSRSEIHEALGSHRKAREDRDKARDLSGR